MSEAGALARYRLAGPSREPAFDAIAAAAALACEVPFAFVSVVDDGMQWMKGRYGSDLASWRPVSSFCDLVMRSGAAVVVEDATEDPDTSDDPLVTGTFGVRFHAGVPIRGILGETLGTLCVLDTKPRTISEAQLAVLTNLGLAVNAHLETRQATLTGRPPESLDLEHRLVLETLPVGYARSDLDGRILDVNPEFCRIVGRPRQELLGRQAPEFPLSDELTKKQIEKDLGDLVAGRRSVMRAERQYRHVSGENVPVFVTTALTRDVTGRPDGLLAFVVDLTAQQRSAEALRISQERFRLGFMSSPTGMALLTMDRQFVEVNDQLCETLGYTPEELVGRPLETLMLPDETIFLRERFSQAERTGGWSWRAERRYRAKNGQLVHAQVSAARIEDGSGGHLMLAQLEDVTHLKLAEQALAKHELTDPLTGLGNRALLERRFLETLQATARSQRPFTILVCDLDGFGLVNEALGHRHGDEVLRLMAARLRSGFAWDCTVSRIGGDEFAVLLPDAGASQAHELLSGLEARLQTPLSVGGEEVRVTVSSGVVEVRADHLPAPDLDLVLLEAGQALRQAKDSGKNRHSIFDIGLLAEAQRRRQAEAALRRALATDGLTVVYQPIVDLKTQRLVGAEALCRLFDHDGTPIPPPVFVDIAEQTGSITALGTAVLTRALTDCASWHARGMSDMHVAVNVSAAQTTQLGYAETVLASLDAAGLEPHHLVLELTETALIDASATTVATLQRLRDAGIGIAIDDFGTGYASLRYIQQLPVTALKIDKTFTQGLPHSREEVAIVQAVTQLASTLRLQCVAEGIETSDQLEYLTPLGLLGQGFLLGPPDTPEALALRWG